MKKALSILLSVMMVAGLFIALVPTASAAVTATSTMEPGLNANKLKTIYAENFDNPAYAGQTGTDLADALGWASTRDVKDETVYTKTESGNTWLGLHGSETIMDILDDPRLQKGNFVLEYTQKITDVGMPNGPAEGYSGYTYGGGAGFRQGYQNGTGKAGWNYLVKERGHFDLHVHGSTNDLYTVNTDTIAGGSYSDRTDSLIGEVWHFKVVVDAGLGIYVYSVDKTDPANPVETLRCALNATNKNKEWESLVTQNGLSSVLQIRDINGPEVLIDDIKVSIYDADSFVISEVSPVAYHDYTVGVELFEYIELYNVSSQPLNVYDYAIGNRSFTVAYLDAGNLSGCSVTTLQPGSGNQVSNGTYTYTYDNPAYEDGVIEPGATAVLVIPRWYAGVTKTAEDFRQMLLKEKLNMGDAADSVKLFTLTYSNGSTNEMNWSGAHAYAIGQKDVFTNNSKLASAEVDSFVIDSKGAAYDGMGHAHAGSAVAAYVGNSYTYWDNDGAYIPGGQLVTTPEGKPGTTPGSIPVDALKPLDVNYVVDGKVFHKDMARLATDYTMSEPVPTKEGYTFTGWVDAEGNPAADIAADQMLDDVTFYATWERNNYAKWVGSQNSVMADNEFDLRLVGSIADLTDVKSIAFVISVNGADEKAVYLNYVYESISTDFGEGIYKPETGYVVALEINGCPETAEFGVKVMTVYQDGSVKTSETHIVTYQEA